MVVSHLDSQVGLGSRLKAGSILGHLADICAIGSSRDQADEIEALRQELAWVREQRDVLLTVAEKAKAWVRADRMGKSASAGSRHDIRLRARTELKAAVDAWNRGSK